jgi:rhodanese-related sulfurtransferase
VKFVLDNLILIALAVASGGMLLWKAMRDGQGGRAGSVTPAEATAALNQRQAVLIDVRPAADFAAGHIAQSRNVPLDDLAQKAASLPKNKPLILVGANGRDSAKAVAQFKAKGFEEVSNLTGGLTGWVGAGMPIRKG